MKYTRKRRAVRTRRTRGGTVYGSQAYAASAAKEADDDCAAHVKAAVDGVGKNVTIERKTLPYWQHFGYASLKKAQEAAEAAAREQSPCNRDAVVVVTPPPPPPSIEPPPTPTVRRKALESRPPLPFGPPQGVPEAPVVGCTGTSCMRGTSRRRGRKSRRRSTRRGARSSRARPIR